MATNPKMQCKQVGCVGQFVISVAE